MLDLKYFTEVEAQEIGLAEIIKGDKECYPEAFQYILTRLQAQSEKDLVVLKVHPTNQVSDEEGWEFESYFPKTKECSIMSWGKDDLGPHLVEVKFEGCTLMGLQDACPMIMYANRKDFENEEVQFMETAENSREAVAV